MAIDVSNLTLVPQRQAEIIGKIIRRETILPRFMAHNGYNPGPALLRIYEGGGDFSDCCEVPESGGEFLEVPTTIACIQSGNEFCEADLARSLNDFEFMFTAGNEQIDGRLEDLFTEQELAKIAINIDRLVFQGDTASSDNNLNKIDGLIKLATNSPLTTKVNITTGNVYQAIAQIIADVPVEAYDMGDIAIIVGRDVAKNLQAYLVAHNLYHYNPGDRGPYDPLVIPGIAGVTIIPNRGLDGTNRVIATPLQNIHWLTNLEGDHMTLNWGYTEYHDRFYWRLRFILGINFGIYENVVIATVSADVINNITPAINVIIDGPLDNGRVAVSTGPAAAGSPVTPSSASIDLQPEPEKESEPEKEGKQQKTK